MTCYGQGGACRNNPMYDNSYTRTLAVLAATPSIPLDFKFVSDKAGSIGQDYISLYQTKSAVLAIGGGATEDDNGFVRCDSATYLPPFGAASAGCVFPDVTERFQVRRSDTRFPEV